jgi:hypothetical protein
VERAWKAVKRRPLVWALGAAAALALLLGSAASTYFGLAAGEQAKRAEQREEEAREALGRLEETLAEGLLAPLGHREEELSDYEMGALDKLAGLSREYDRVRVRFVAKALESPGAAVQLERQAEEAISAAVGLRRELRDEIIELLATRLRDRQSEKEVRVACAVILARLNCQDPELARLSLDVLLAQIVTTTESRALDRYGSASRQLIAPLHGKEAAEVARVIVNLAAETPDSNHRITLGEPFAALAPKLPEQAAKDVARLAHLLVALPNTHRLSPYQVFLHRQALIALASRLPDRDATQLARMVASRTAKTTNQGLMESLVQAFAVLAPRLPPEEASEQAVELAREFISWAAATTDADLLGSLGDALAILGSRLPAKEAAELARVIVSRAAKTPGAAEVAMLAEGFAVLASKLPADQTSKDAASLARALVLIEDGKIPVGGHRSYNRALAALGPHIPAEQAEALARFIAPRAAKASSASELTLLAGRFAALAPKLPADQARRVSSEQTRAIVACARNHSSPPESVKLAELPPLAEAVTALALRLPVAEANKLSVELARCLRAHLAKRATPWELTMVAAAFAALAPTLPSAEAAKFAEELAPRLGWLLRGSDYEWKLSATLPPLVSEHTLINILKQPGAGSDFRAAAVAEFGRRLKRTFRDQWDLAEYLERHRPDLDVAGPLSPRKESRP